MKTPQAILASFDGNISRCAVATGVSRATWHNWKRDGFPKALPAKLELWVIKNTNPPGRKHRPAAARPR